MGVHVCVFIRTSLSCFRLAQLYTPPARPHAYRGLTRGVSRVFEDDVRDVLAEAARALPVPAMWVGRDKEGRGGGGGGGG